MMLARVVFLKDRMMNDCCCHAGDYRAEGGTLDTGLGGKKEKALAFHTGLRVLNDDCEHQMHTLNDKDDAGLIQLRIIKAAGKCGNERSSIYLGFSGRARNEVC